MDTRLSALKLLAGQTLSTQDGAALLAVAKRVAQATEAGKQTDMLKGRHLALMVCGDTEAAALFRQAAEGLGAHVSQIPLERYALTTQAEVQKAAQILSKLYDAVEYQGVAASLVRELANAATVPVFECLACQSKRLNPQIDQLDQPYASADKMRLGVQTILVSVINGR